MLKLKVPSRECVGAATEDTDKALEEQHVSYRRRPVLEFLLKIKLLLWIRMFLTPMDATSSKGSQRLQEGHCGRD